jgi:hypothetical protein
LGFLHYIAGELSKTLSAKLESARTPLKELRDDDAALSQKRNVRAGLENQIARIERGKERGYEKRVAELREQLAKAESDGEPAERQHEILVRRALKDSERERFQAFREVIQLLWSDLLSSHHILVWREAVPFGAGC